MVWALVRTGACAIFIPKPGAVGFGAQCFWAFRRLAVNSPISWPGSRFVALFQAVQAALDSLKNFLIGELSMATETLASSVKALAHV
jgi:hypothetical protein